MEFCEFNKLNFVINVLVGLPLTCNTYIWKLIPRSTTVSCVLMKLLNLLLRSALTLMSVYILWSLLVNS